MGWMRWGVVLCVASCGLDERGLGAGGAGGGEAFQVSGPRRSVDAGRPAGQPPDTPATSALPPTALPGVSTPLAGPGAACAGDQGCASGHCTEGICCAQACTGPCVSCRLAPTIGLCRSLPPHTVCAAATCSDGVEHLTSMCDGAGRCVAGKERRCEDRRCANATSCAKACNEEDDERNHKGDDDCDD